jgi:hypothetical protein
LSSLRGAEGQTFRTVAECDRYVNQGGTVATTVIAWDSGSHTLAGLGFTPDAPLSLYVVDNGVPLGPPFPFTLADGSGRFFMVLGAPPPGFCGPAWIVGVTDGVHSAETELSCPT